VPSFDATAYAPTGAVAAAHPVATYPRRLDGPPAAADTASPEVAIRERRFLTPPRWERSGTLEWLATRFLSERDRVVADFLMAGPPHWTWRWKLGAGIAVAAVALSYLAPWVVAVAGLAACAIGAPLLGGDWPGLGLVTIGAMAMPAYAPFPVGFARMARVLYRTTLIRCLAWVPLFGGLAAQVAGHASGDPIAGVTFAAKAAFAYLAALPLIVGMRLATGVGDVRALRPRALLWHGALILGGIAFAAAAWRFFTVRWASPVLPAIWMLVIPPVTLRLCAFAHDRCRVDLLRRAPNAP
jgi:hypothetical protein